MEALSHVIIYDIVYRMEAKTSVDMPSTTLSSEKNDEGFIVPSARAVETASKIEVGIYVSIVHVETTSLIVCRS